MKICALTYVCGKSKCSKLPIIRFVEFAGLIKDHIFSTPDVIFYEVERGRVNLERCNGGQPLNNHFLFLK